MFEYSLRKSFKIINDTPLIKEKIKRYKSFVPGYLTPLVLYFGKSVRKTTTNNVNISIIIITLLYLHILFIYLIILSCLWVIIFDTMYKLVNIQKIFSINTIAIYAVNNISNFLFLLNV